MSTNPPPADRHPTPSPTFFPTLKCFTNCHLIISGELISQDLYFSPTTGLITPNYYYRSDGIERIDLGGAIVSPGFLDLQTNGMGGFHFTMLGGEGRTREEDERALEMVARMEVEVGVTAWWATVPTVERRRWREILPLLSPRPFPASASLLGAHAEGPYLHPSKNGAHNSSYFLTPTGNPTYDLETLYGLPPPPHPNPNSNPPPHPLKLLTLCPLLPHSLPLITHLHAHHPHLTLSLGHTPAPYPLGLSALTAGATALTHVFNAMAPLHHRSPGLAALIGHPTLRPYYSLIADGVHVAGPVLRIALWADPGRCVLITDAVEVAGLKDGVYPGNGQVGGWQRKVGGRVTLIKERETNPGELVREGEAAKTGGDAAQAADPAEEETLIGSCATVLDCVNNMMGLTGCTLAEAVRCVTENVAGMMRERGRGVLEPGRRADFVVLDWVGRGEGVGVRAGAGVGEGGSEERFRREEVRVRETWVEGVRVYENTTGKGGAAGG